MHEDAFYRSLSDVHFKSTMVDCSKRNAIIQRRYHVAHVQKLAYGSEVKFRQMFSEVDSGRFMQVSPALGN